MDFKACSNYLASKPEATLDFPFDPDVYVYKVCGKMFALVSPSGNQTPEKHPQMNIKCDPDHALELRDVFEAVIPGYHMNKRHWNTIILDGSLPASEIQRMIDHSYALVAKKLTKAQRTPLELKYGPEALYQELKPK
jgi:predicted DNA-binding protein (MmcQ/YjbR family)